MNPRSYDPQGPFGVGEGILNDDKNRSADDKHTRDSASETTTITVEESDAVVVDPRDDSIVELHR